MNLHELKRGVEKGSQKRAKHPLGTDDPDKYIGKWEEYTEPQGIKAESSMFTAGWSSDSPANQSPTNAELLNADPKEIKKAQKAPLKKANRDVRATTNNLVKGIQVVETIRSTPVVKLNGEYFVMDGIGDSKEDVGYALVSDGIIGEIVIKDDLDEKRGGEILHKILLLITREADWTGANLSTQLNSDAPVIVKRHLEQFGFRGTKDGIMKRTNNSATPPESY